MGFRIAWVVVIWSAGVVAACVAGVLNMTVLGVHLPFTIVYFTPIVATLALYRLSDRFRSWALALDLRLLLISHSSRFAGFGTLYLYFNDLTSPIWSISAGLGDVIAALALTTLGARGFVNGRLSRQSVKFWTLFGLFDFVHALVLAVLLLPSAIGLLAGAHVTQNASAALHFPFVLVPAVFVPFLFSIHLMVLVQLRDKYRGGGELVFD